MKTRFNSIKTLNAGSADHVARPSTKAGWCVFVFVLFFISIVASTPAQENIQFTQGAVDSGLDNTLSVPLRSYPGRGAASLPISLSYSSRVWRIDNVVTVNNITSYQSIAQAVYGENSTSGWKTSLDLPIIEWPKSTDEYYFSGKPYCYVCGSNFVRFRVRRVYIHMPDGSTHELRKSDQPYQGAIDMTGTFYAVDGSRMRYDSTGANTGTLYLPNGTRYILNETSAQYIDRNGNTLNYNASNRQWTDTLGRVIGMPWPVNPQAGQDYSYQLPGFGGNTSITYTLRWKYLADALTPDPSTGQLPTRKTIANDYLPFPSLPPTNYQGNNYPQTIVPVYSERPSLFISEGDDFAPYTIVLGKGQIHDELFNPVVLAEIVLPTGLSYKFSYNIYGEIDKIIYPTGGYETYQYGEVTPISTLVIPYLQASRGVTSRKWSANGTGNDLVEWLYTTSVTKTPNIHANGIYGTQTETIRQSIQAPPHGQNQSRYWAFGFEDARNGTVTEVRVYALNADGSRGAMLRRKLTKYEQTSVAVPPRLGLPGETTETAYRNVRPVKEVNLILDTGGNALARTSTSSYDTTYQVTTGLDLLTSTESSFAEVDQSVAQTAAIDTISPGAGTIVRLAETTYSNSSGYRDRNILALPTVSVVKDYAGNIVTKSETLYDEFALLTYSDMTSVPDYTDPNTTVRGNATTTRNYYDITNGLYLKSQNQYDQCGNVRNSWNERDILTQSEYSATYKRAYATLATTAVPDPSGAHGSSSPFTATNTFDYTTGVALTVTDANGQVSTFGYFNDQGQVDPLNRLRKVTRPDGGWTKTVYNDALGNIYVYTESQVDALRVTKSYQYFDAMGRTVRTYAHESGTTYLISDTQYDKMGRVSRVSSPYRGTLGSAVNPSNHWTSSAFDAMGRTTAVTFSDATTNWTVQTEYHGIYTTVTDEALKKRRQKVDGFGRVVRVDEPDSAGNLGGVDAPAHATFYEYDTGGNLIHITQGPTGQLQHRYYKYDSLSRLTYERQVEQNGTFTSADPLTNNSQWSRKLVYDETINGVSYKGLVTSMYDARNVQTQYQYDQLNRIWQISYNDGTPTLYNNYDQTRTGYFNKDKLTEIITAAVGDIPQTSQVYDFDLMGRVVKQIQNVDSNAYTLRYAYNLGGQLIRETYPSGRVVNFGYDEASRLSNVNGGNNHNFISAISYTPTGAISSATLGNNTDYSYGFNSRRQLTNLQASRNSTILQKYEYKYGKINSDGTTDEAKNSGQIGRIESWIGTQKQWQQRFDYDYIGRLKESSEYRGDNGQQSYKLAYRYNEVGSRFQYQADNPGNPFIQKWVEANDISSSTNRYASNVTYDNAGNITADPRFRNLEYSYDANGRMKQSSQAGGINPVKSVFDGVGQRVATKVNGALISLMVYDAGGKLVAEYGQTPPATTSIQYVFADHQGTPRLVTNNAGGVYSRHDYQPYGEELSSTVGMRSQTPGYGTLDNVRQKYAGMESDDATNMAHTLWRKYDGQSGRWTSPDPYGGSMTTADPQSFNRYTYVNNDPVNQIDPLGLMSGADASQSWGDVAGTFWGSGFDFNASHMVGRSIINAAEARYDQNMRDHADYRLVKKYIEEGNYAAATQVMSRNDTVGVETEDGEELWGSDAANHVNETVAAQQENVTVDEPYMELAQVPDGGSGYYVYGARNHQYGALQVVNDLIVFADQWNRDHPDNPIGIGNLTTATQRNRVRASHRSGHAADIRPMRTDNQQVGGTTFRSAAYSQPLTQELVTGLLALPNVESIIFNDPAVTDTANLGRVRRDATGDHDNHLHVVFRP